MSSFAQWQPRYAAQGIPTFPMSVDGQTKKPAIRHYQRVGLAGSRQLAFEFPDFDAFAFMVGPRNRMTIIDIDAPDDEDLLGDMLRQHGDTPLISRTGSGGFHLYYRHNGEGRRIRPDPDLPVDILGAGLVVAPPSRAPRGAYRFIRGTLDDLARLPHASPGANHTSAPTPAPALTPAQAPLIEAGQRNKRLWAHLQAEARHIDDLEALVAVGRSYADANFDRQAGHPFNDAEVARVARSVLRWKQQMIAEGTYFVGTGRYLKLSHDRIDQVSALGPHPLALYVFLSRHFGGLSSFTIPNGLRQSMPGGPWSLERFRKARNALLDNGLIRETRAASTRHGPASHAWPEGVGNRAP